MSKVTFDDWVDDNRGKGIVLILLFFFGMFALAVLSITWLAGLEFIPHEFVETIGEEKCAEHGQSFDWYSILGDRVKFFCSDNSSRLRYDSVEVILE